MEAEEGNTAQQKEEGKAAPLTIEKEKAAPRKGGGGRLHHTREGFERRSTTQKDEGEITVKLFQFDLI